MGYHTHFITSDGVISMYSMDIVRVGIECVNARRVFIVERGQLVTLYKRWTASSVKSRNGQHEIVVNRKVVNTGDVDNVKSW